VDETMSQNSLRNDTGTASTAGSTRLDPSVQEWIAAAIAAEGQEVTRPGAPPSLPTPRPSPGGELGAPAEAASAASSTPSSASGSYERLAEAAAASERRSVETASKTAAALSSVTSWIVDADDRLAETARKAVEAEQRAAASVQDAVGAFGQKLVEFERRLDVAPPQPLVEDALRAIERIESRLDSSSAPSPASSALDLALRGFEQRVSTLTDRLMTAPLPSPKRAAAAGDFDSAVAEIRARQDEIASGKADLPRAIDAPRGPTGWHRDVLMTLKADVAKLADHMDGGPSRGDDESVVALKSEIDAVQRSMDGLATRDDLDKLNSAIRDLSARVELSKSAGEIVAHGDVMTVGSELRRMARAQETEDAACILRDLEVLSHKFDIVAANGSDPELVRGLAEQLDGLRASFAGIAQPGEIAALSAQVQELERQIALSAERQVAPDDFERLVSAVEEIRSGLHAAGQTTEVHDTAPIAAMMSTLIEKIERVERNAVDGSALDSLERQIALLTERLNAGPTRDPAVATLHQATTELLGEVSAYRTGMVELAAKAAREAVIETMGSAPHTAGADIAVLEHDIANLKSRYNLAESFTEQSLRSVHTTLESVVDRLATLEAADRRPLATDVHQTAPLENLTASGAPLRSGPQSAAEAAGEDALRRLADQIAAAESDRTAAPARDEILLEPGAARPVPVAAVSTASPTEDPTAAAADIKANFIAAARRAAQAAALEAGASRGKGTKISGLGSKDSPSQAGGRFRATLDRHRRPLLLAAAAITLAIGSFQMIRNLMQPGEPRPVVAVQGDVGERSPATAPSNSATSPGVDPLTTQSLAMPAEPIVPTPDKPADLALPAKSADLPAPGSETRQAALSSPPAAPSSPAPLADRVITPGELTAALPAGLKQAAASGDPVATFELASRTAEGRGVPRDPIAAAKLFEKAAEKGLAPAMYRVGNVYEKGVGAPRDLELAKNWYRRAADSGNVRAMHNLAVLVAEGSGKPDYPAALGLFQRAAEQGVRDSQYNLAVLYARGLGTAQDFSKSYLWFSIAAASGDEDANRKRDEVATRLSPTDLAKAKAAAERWRATPPNLAANEVRAPANGWAEAPAPRKPSRDGRV
jgi:localization factor PodJL